MKTLDTVHPQTRIAFEGREANVDEAIASLILELWRAGIQTSLSCQDNNGGRGGERVWIEFPLAVFAEAFLAIAAGNYDDAIESLHNRIACRWLPLDDADDFRERREWHYVAYPISGKTYVVEVGDERRSLLPFAVSVRFPRDDYDEVLSRLRRHNAAQRGRKENGR